MEQPVTDGDYYAYHRQLVVADVVTPISQSLSSSSSVTRLSPNSSPLSPNDGARVDTVSPSNMLGNSKFTLPKGWSVQEVPRKSRGVYDKVISDKYYRDPETGLQFRSLKEVERFITEGIKPTKSRAKQPKFSHHEKTSATQDMVVAGGKMLDMEEDEDNHYQLANVSTTSISPTSSFKLPEGWVVEEVPRKFGSYVDKYYYEPGTGQKFRSLTAVQRHLAELEENSPLSVVLEEIRENNLPLSKAFKLSSRIKYHGSYDSWKKSISRKEKMSSFPSPPSKINWVIAGSGGDTWNAFVDDTLVPDSVKQRWEKTFMMAINDSNHKAPVSEQQGLVLKLDDYM